MNNNKDKDTYLELVVTFADEYINREQTNNISHKEYLITRGLPSSLTPHGLRRTQIIRCQLIKPLNSAAEGYLNNLKDIAIIQDWRVEEIKIEGRGSDQN